MKWIILEDSLILSSYLKKKLEKEWFSIIVYNKISDFVDIDVDFYIIDLHLETTSHELIEKLKGKKKPIIIHSGYDFVDIDIEWVYYIPKLITPDKFIWYVKEYVWMCDWKRM